MSGILQGCFKSLISDKLLGFFFIGLMKNDHEIVGDFRDEYDGSKNKADFLKSALKI